MDAIGRLRGMDRYEGLKCWYVLVIALSLFDIVSRGFLSRLPISPLTALVPLFVLVCVVRTMSVGEKAYFRDVSFRPILLTFLFYNIVIIVRGFLNCEDYWDFKDVTHKLGALIIPAIALLGFRASLYRQIYRYLLTWYVLMSLLFCGHIFYPVQGLPLLFAISWLLLYKRDKWFWFLVLFVVLSIYGNFSSRGWILRAFFALMSMYAYKHISVKAIVYKVYYTASISITIILLTLGYTGVFNVFAMDEYVSSKNEEMTADTRSLLYFLVHEKLENENKELIGLGAKSEYWKGFHDRLEMKKDVRKHGRSATESGLLNFYLMGGWIGGILYSVVFWCAAYLAIFRSRSKMCKFIGMFVLFRWVISFIDEPQAWYLNYIMLFMTIGFCLSKTFRSMDDIEIQKWIKSI